MRGRKPRPTVLKLIAGERSDRINDREPKYGLFDASPPDYLTKHGRKMWAELVNVLGDSGTLTAADRHALGTLCACFELWREDPTNGAARKDWIRLLCEFGMTPSTRSKIKVGASPTDELDQFLA